jgi:S1-C subfamily serine protease
MGDYLKQLSADMATAATAAGNSIVRVEARRRAHASGVIYSSDGVIVTTHHVVERDENISIGLPDGTKAGATLVGRDPSTDLAVLRVEANGLQAARWAAAEDVQVGQLVLALGRPGERIQATLGVISAVEEGWRTHGGGKVDAYLQTDVIMYPGFSGGPLLSANGDFIGINSSALMRGASVTLPAATVSRVAQALLAHGHVRRGYLGVSAQPVRLPAALAGELGQETGLLVAAVETGSPAENAGMLLGDTLIALADQRIRHMDDLMAALSSDRVGKTVAARIVRGGKTEELSVTIGERE